MLRNVLVKVLVFIQVENVQKREKTQVHKRLRFILFPQDVNVLVIITAVGNGMI